MPRKWLEAVRDWPALRTNRCYAAQVLGVDRVDKAPGMTVCMELVGHEHAGRTVSVELGLPCRPGGVTAEFFRACGFTVAPGARIAPKDAIGRRVRVRFVPVQDGQDYEVVGFAPLAEDGRASGKGRAATNEGSSDRSAQESTSSPSDDAERSGNRAK